MSITNNFAFEMNFDWFNPFIHTQHSEGAIYLSILNLPRHERFLQENILLVGVIPGPKEPPLNINSFLKPLVKELNNMWCGIQLKMQMNIAFLFVVHLSALDVIFLLLARLGGFLVIAPLEDAPNVHHLSQLKHLGRRLIILILTDVLGNHAPMQHRENAMKHLQSSTLAECN